ncbi:MAG: hypothetical protein II183_02495, partial [Elusimicrobiaceae bacterium]|nr:hypothetical protein [Elusimicrobiaceae bacterium]
MKVKMIKVALGFCLLSQILTAQEIFLLPQGKDHPFPDSNLFKYIQTKQICWECDGGYESVATNLMKAV